MAPWETKKIICKSLQKSEKMSIKQWINRIKNINSNLPLMKWKGWSLTEEDLIAKVIAKNILYMG